MSKSSKLAFTEETLYALNADKTRLQSYDVGCKKWTKLRFLPTDISIDDYYDSDVLDDTAWSLVGATISEKYCLVVVRFLSDTSRNQITFWEYSSASNNYVLLQKLFVPVRSIYTVHGLASPGKGLLLIGLQDENINIQKTWMTAPGNDLPWEQLQLTPVTKFVPKPREWTASFLCGSNLVMVGLPSQGFVFNIDHRIWTNFAVEVLPHVLVCGDCFQCNSHLFLYSDPIIISGDYAIERQLFELDVDEGRFICWDGHTDPLTASENPRILREALEKLHCTDGIAKGNATSSTAHQMWLTPQFSLCQYVIDLFLSRKGADISFLVEDQEVPAHKYFVTKCCPYFGSLIGALSNKRPTQPAVLADFSFNSFSVFLEYQYTGWIGPGAAKIAPSFSVDLAKKCIEDADRICFQEYALCCVEWAARRLTTSQFPDYYHFVRELRDRDNPSSNEYIRTFWEVVKGKFRDEEASSNKHFEDFVKLVRCQGDSDITFTIQKKEVKADKIICSRFPKLAHLILGKVKLRIDVPFSVWTAILKYIYSDKFCIPREIYTLTKKWCKATDKYFHNLGVGVLRRKVETNRGWKDATEFWGEMLRGANLAGVPAVKRVASALLSRRANMLSWEQDGKEICRMLAHANKGKSFDFWQNVISFVHADRTRIESEHMTDLELTEPSTAFSVMESGWTLESPNKRFKYDEWWCVDCKFQHGKKCTPHDDT